MIEFRGFNHLICQECTQRHIELNRAPVCCHRGRLSLTLEESENLGLAGQTSLDLESNGCPFWKIQENGCSVYRRRPLICRFFPPVYIYSQLLNTSLGIYSECFLVQFILALWERRISAPAWVKHSNSQIDNTPLFDENHLPLIANLCHWADSSLEEAKRLLEIAQSAYKKNQSPVVILFYADFQDGSLRATKPFPLREIQEILKEEQYPSLAGLVYPPFNNRCFSSLPTVTLSYSQK